MFPLHLSEAEISVINIERKTHNSALIRDRLNVLYQLHNGFSRSDCALIVGCHVNSVSNYIKMYKQGGLTLLKQLNYGYPKHELQDTFEKVDEVLKQCNCNTVSDAQELLREHFSYNRSKEAVRQLLHRLGYKRRKVGCFPGKVNNFDAWQKQQDAFVEKLYTLIQAAENKEVDLVFSDAVHFVYGKFNSYTWSKTPQYASSGHGRYRINVYGAYDVVTNQVYSMYNLSYINAEFIVEYLNWLRSEIYQNLNRQLYFILDNARYQHCDYVKRQAEKLNITLEFLPAYSPNLNLIERLWKYLKNILAKQYHQNKMSFKEAIVSVLNSLGNQQHQEKLWSLLNPIFQRFEKSQILSL